MSLLALRSGGEQTHIHASSYAALFPSAAVSSSAGPDSRGFLIGPGWTQRTAQSLPLRRSAGTIAAEHTRACGWGRSRKTGLVLDKEHWEPASDTVGSDRPTPSRLLGGSSDPLRPGLMVAGGWQQELAASLEEPISMAIWYPQRERAKGCGLAWSKRDHHCPAKEHS